MSKREKAADAATKVIKSGTVAPGQGMTMELSEAANGLPDGHVLHWHTEEGTLVEAEAEAGETEQQGEPAE